MTPMAIISAHDDDTRRRDGSHFAGIEEERRRRHERFLVAKVEMRRKEGWRAALFSRRERQLGKVEMRRTRRV